MAGLYEKLILNRVSLDDYEKVMTIRNKEEVFDGRDRLPFQFHRIVGSSNTLAFAALLEDDSIAFSLAYIIDNGKTCVSKSSRVATKHEGKGVMKWLFKEMVDVVKASTGVLNLASLYFYESEERRTLHLTKSKAITTVDRAFTEFYINRRNLFTSKEKFSINTTSKIKLLDRQQLEVLLTLPHTSASLFPECRVVIDLVPYRPIKPSVAYMIQTTKSVIGSNLDDANSSLISFGNYSEVYQGLLYYIDLYGNVMKNIEAHIQYHMERIKNIESESDNFVIQIYCEKHANIDLVLATLKKFGFGLEENNPEYCLCVERNIR
ncbi:unnamed protein product [Mytilus coruscus]|uniref:Histidine N-acetyltransferase C-terminal domain-containing protein n=1 Tax=Mytilus coruscus TaxID=42192 RepID=A0A6J8B3N8_MYTCO|nr:unnamed protein product [Mytilus coruscus]